MKILAIDQGTTSTRALVMDKVGRSVITASKEHRQYYPEPGRVEHDPEELLANIRYCLESADDIDVIGIDNQGESCLAWDAKTGEAVTPVIVWQDNRTQEVVDRLKADNVEGLVLEKSGLPLDSYFSAAKLGWIVKNVPEAGRLLQQGRLRLGTTDAFFIDRLTGHFVSDISTASRTSLMDVRTGSWDTDLCEIFGVPIEALPEIVPTVHGFGAITCGKRRVLLRASVVDQQAALYGHGCRLPGDAKITFGTGAFVLALTGGTPFMAAEKGLLPTVAWQVADNDPVYALDGGVFSAASAVNWAQKIGLFSDYGQIESFDPDKKSAVSRDLVFIPALTGLGCPHWDRKAGGSWIGLSLDTEPLDLMQSILEGIAFRASEVIETIQDFVDVTKRISIDGGLSANSYFCQFLADVLNMEVVVQPNAELTAVGTAMLAAGDEAPPYDADKKAVNYLPLGEAGRYREKFREAVRRTKAWRG